jgi:hypothetical protein
VTAAQVLRTVRAVPFQRFAIYLADGREMVIGHPECVQLIGGGRIALVLIGDAPLEAVDVLMIVSLRPIKSDGRTGTP